MLGIVQLRHLQKSKTMKTTTKNDRFAAAIAGTKAALEGEKMDVNPYDETDDLHFEWLAAWTDARLAMMRRPSQNGHVLPLAGAAEKQSL